MTSLVFFFAATLTLLAAWMIVLTAAWVKARHRHDRLVGRVRAMQTEVVKAKRIRHTTGSIPKVVPLPDNPPASVPFRLMPTEEYAEMAQALADAQAALPPPDPTPSTAPIGAVKKPSTRGRHSAR